MLTREEKDLCGWLEARSYLDLDNVDGLSTSEIFDILESRSIERGFVYCFEAPNDGKTIVKLAQTGENFGPFLSHGRYSGYEIILVLRFNKVENAVRAKLLLSEL